MREELTSRGTDLKLMQSIPVRTPLPTIATPVKRAIGDTARTHRDRKPQTA